MPFPPIDENLEDADRSVRDFGFNRSSSLMVAIGEHRKRTSKVNSSISEIWNGQDLDLIIGNSCLDACNTELSTMSWFHFVESQT
jgi:hypothetical protein